MEYKLIRHISSRTQNFIDSSHIFTNVKKEHLLPEYREVLFVLLDKMVEVQDENPDENDVWRIEKVTESEKLEGHGLDGQNFVDLYNAMIEIYKGLKRFRRFWKNAMQKVCGSIEADVKSRREIRRMINDLKREFGSDNYKLFEEINF